MLFVGTAFRLSTGQTSEVVKTDRGAYILRVEEKQAVDKTGLASAKEMLSQQVLSQKRQEVFTVWFADLRENARDCRLPPFLLLRLLRGSDNVIRLALSQINVTVGDLAGNRDKILDHVHRARDLGAHIVVFPELAIPGYPPEDLLFKPRFIQSKPRCVA